MVKILIICLGMFILAVITTFIITLPKEVHSISSPSNKYTIQITERRSFPFIDSESVYLNASTENKPLVRGKLLYTGDFMDDDFIDRYPNYQWISESILKIGQPQGKQSDNLQISNETPFQLKYLLIETYKDKFIVFNVKPSEKIDLSFRFFGRLSVEGEFFASVERFGDAIELVDKKATKDKNQFLINVKADKVTIQSENQEINHVTCCAVDR